MGATIFLKVRQANLKARLAQGFENYLSYDYQKYEIETPGTILPVAER